MEVSMGQLYVPLFAAAELGALAAILPRSFAISSYWVVVAAVSRSSTTMILFAAKARD